MHMCMHTHKHTRVTYVICICYLPYLNNGVVVCSFITSSGGPSQTRIIKETRLPNIRNYYIYFRINIYIYIYIYIERERERECVCVWVCVRVCVHVCDKQKILTITQVMHRQIEWRSPSSDMNRLDT